MIVSSKNGYELTVPKGYHLGKSGGLMRTDPKVKISKKQRRKARGTGKHSQRINNWRQFLIKNGVPGKANLTSRKTVVVGQDFNIGCNYSEFVDKMTMAMVESLGVPKEIFTGGNGRPTGKTVTVMKPSSPGLTCIDEAKQSIKDLNAYESIQRKRQWVENT